MTTEDKIQIHVVHSVKGGCGKTAFSLFRALELSSECRKSQMENSIIEYGNQVPVIWLDADFKGSASRVLFYAETQQDFEANQAMTIEGMQKLYPDIFAQPQQNSANRLYFNSNFVKYTLNDYLLERKKELEKITVHGLAGGTMKKSIEEHSQEHGYINAFLDFIFVSSSMKEKRQFRYGNIRNEVPALGIGRYLYLMESLLTRICEKGRVSAGGRVYKSGGYRHVVIDMPPGYDEYSNALLCMLRKFVEEKTGYHAQIKIYELTTGDRGHIASMQGSLQDIINTSYKFKHKEEIYAVLSEVREGEIREPSQLANRIRGINKDIKVLLCKYQDNYYRFCRGPEDPMFGYSIEEV